MKESPAADGAFAHSAHKHFSTATVINFLTTEGAVERRSKCAPVSVLQRNAEEASHPISLSVKVTAPAGPAKCVHGRLTKSNLGACFCHACCIKLQVASSPSKAVLAQK